MSSDFEKLTPAKIVAYLDEFIVGQAKAKRAVAIALRNRVRRQRLPEEMRDEVAPKNILMIGPTGVGKTEIARRISKLCGAPFVKVEATKYTEVGYVGRDVESMIRDLMHAGFSMVKAEMHEQVRPEAEKRAEEAMLDLLLPPARRNDEGQAGFNLGRLFGMGGAQPPQGEPTPPAPPAAPPEPKAADESRERLRTLLREGRLEDRKVEVNVASGGPSVEIFSGAGMEDMEMNLAGLSNLFGSRKKKKTVTVAEARGILAQEEMDKLIDHDRVAAEAKRRVEQMGIIFLDEIDKIASAKGTAGGVDVSREGVQRDILPIVEGSTVNTKYGIVDTTHILFIAAGAFNVSKPSDLIPELQGRFPIRVELEALTAGDFERILQEPRNALTRQYAGLLGTEGVELEFHAGAIKRLSEIATEINSRTENIGARRLHTILERLLEELSFNADQISGQKVTITVEYVDERFKDVIEDQDLGRYIL